MSHSHIENMQSALSQAEQALGENLVWLADHFDLQIRQKDLVVLYKLQQLNDAWKSICIVLNDPAGE